MTADIRRPKLRFPGFSGEWRREELGKVTKWSSGGTPAKDNPRYWGGDVPWISAASMYGSTFSRSERTLTELGARSGTKVAKQGSLLLLVRGSMLFNMVPVGIAGRDVAFNQDVKAITSDILDSRYLLYFFRASEHKLLSKVVGTGIGAGKLDMEDMYGLTVAVSSLDEQQKIAEFLASVDDRIGLSERRLELLKKYKQGVMQKIFTQQIRFKDSSGRSYPKWEEKELREVAAAVTARNQDESISLVLTNSATAGIVNQSDYFDKDIANQGNLANYHVVSVDDFVYNPRVSQSAPVGPVKRNHLSVGAMSPLYSVFRFKEGNLDFFEGYFSTAYWYKYIKSVANSGARHDRMNITTSDLYGMPIPFPSAEEQQKIAGFLTALDDKIKLEESKLEQAKQFKKSLLQQLFV